MFRHFLLCPSDTAMCCRCPPCDYVLSNRSPISKRVHCNCAVFVLYHYCIFTLSPLYLYCICTLSLLYLYCTCTLSLLYLYCICTLLCFITTVFVLYCALSLLCHYFGVCVLLFTVFKVIVPFSPLVFFHFRSRGVRFPGRLMLLDSLLPVLDHCASIRHFKILCP